MYFLPNPVPIVLVVELVATWSQAFEASVDLLRAIVLWICQNLCFPKCLVGVHKNRDFLAGCMCQANKLVD